MRVYWIYPGSLHRDGLDWTGAGVFIWSSEGKILQAKRNRPQESPLRQSMGPLRRIGCLRHCCSVGMFVTVVLHSIADASGHIPSTLDGPFTPVTVTFDTSLRQGSDDLPVTDPRVAKKVSGFYPEQISLALSTPDALWISWLTGDAQLAPEVLPLDPSTVGSDVLYGIQSGQPSMTAKGNSSVYNQIYPFEGLLNYSSGIIHHVRLTGLLPNATYHFTCGDNAQGIMSPEKSFRTLPSPSPLNYPARVAVVGDLGLTYNSTTTMEHILQNDPTLLLMIGDLSYANQYLTTGNSSSCYSCSFPNSPIRETYQPHWDNWQRFMEPLTSKIPMMVIEGNHEIEPQANGTTFAAYQARFAVPSEESGSGSNFYYSFNAGGIHFVMLGGYVDYNQTGAQYQWLLNDLESVNRAVTPWVIAAWHPPWYNSYNSHYKEVECMRLQMEDVLYRAKVDLVFSGHVHAYERMNRVYNYALDPCAPVYITVGDGGNIEKVDIQHADDPGQCPTPASNIPEYGEICAANFTSGPAAGQFCWTRQPEWSAFRDSSFGHGILEVLNSTHALWTWHRNQDAYGSAKVGDQIYIVRRPEGGGEAPKQMGSIKRPARTKGLLLLALAIAKVGWMFLTIKMYTTDATPIERTYPEC